MGEFWWKMRTVDMTNQIMCGRSDKYVDSFIYCIPVDPKNISGKKVIIILV